MEGVEAPRAVGCVEGCPLPTGEVSGDSPSPEIFLVFLVEYTVI